MAFAILAGVSFAFGFFFFPSFYLSAADFLTCRRVLPWLYERGADRRPFGGPYSAYFLAVKGVHIMLHDLLFPRAASFFFFLSFLFFSCVRLTDPVSLGHNLESVSPTLTRLRHGV